MPFPPPPKKPDPVLVASHPISSKPGTIQVPFTPTEHGPKEDTRLTEDDVSFILKANLSRNHHGDPNVTKFIMSYLECRNTAQAARESGLSAAQGRSLRLKVDVHAAITKLTEKAVMKFGYDASEVIERVKEIAGLDPVEFENPDGSYKTHLSQIAPEARRAIKKFKVKNLFGQDANGMNVVIGQLIEVEVWDKLKSLELLGREKNVMKETKKIEHDVTKNMASVLLDSARRADDRAREVIELNPGRGYETDRESSDSDGSGRKGNGV